MVREAEFPVDKKVYIFYYTARLQEKERRGDGYLSLNRQHRRGEKQELVDEAFQDPRDASDSCY